MKQFGNITTELTKQVQGINEPWKCPECKDTQTKYILRIIPTNSTVNFFPRWIPQFKEVCANCGRYKRFAPQSEILVDRFNTRLESITITARPERDGV